MRRSTSRLAAWLVCGVAALTAVAVWRLPELNAWWWYANSGKPSMTAGTPALSEPLHWVDDYYAVADLGRGDYAIGEPKYGQCNFSYLIVGSQRAILFDTGPGLRDIRNVAERLTTLPIAALPSHLHFDHVGNLGRFDQVVLPDLPALHAQMRGGKFALGFEQFLGFVEGFKRPTFAVTEWASPESEIDLGNRRLTLLSVPGHTPDSVVLLDRQTHRLFAGDFIYPSSIYAQLPGANLSDYARSAHRVLQALEDSATVYGGHGCDRLPKVDVPILGRTDVADLERSLVTADTAGWREGTGWYPRKFPINEKMTLLAKYPWMRP
jgi:glyoxylase-like metal-dependent hydrolase (beta-lactamase superfamily II)